MSGSGVPCVDRQSSVNGISIHSTRSRRGLRPFIDGIWEKTKRGLNEMADSEHFNLLKQGKVKNVDAPAPPVPRPGIRLPDPPRSLSDPIPVAFRF